MVLNKRALEKAFSPKKRVSLGTPSKSLSTASVKPSISTNIQVVVRVRPENDKEREDNLRNVINVINNRTLVFDPTEDTQPFFFRGIRQQRRDFLKRQNKNLEFNFDRIFDENATNEEVFCGSTKDMISTLLEGYNSSVFVYGATGAGKTHTMLGSITNPGITYLTMLELYRQMKEMSDKKDFDIGISYLEVYNETVNDLLRPSKPLVVMDDGRSGVLVNGLNVQRIKNADELLQTLSFGNKNRTQHPTDANAESSRSHAVFQVYVKMTDKQSTSQVKIVKLSMIDLAGSERAAATGCKGIRFKEGANINRSLLALGNCINALAEGKKPTYRDSKLTRLLKDSLGGNCHTIMIANIAPSFKSFEDTYNTLKYAMRAKKIKSKLTKNIMNKQLHSSQYIDMIEKLQNENAQLKARLEQSEQEKVSLKTLLNINLTTMSPTLKTTPPSRTSQINSSTITKSYNEFTKTEESLKEALAKLESFEDLEKKRHEEEHNCDMWKKRLDTIYTEKTLRHREILNVQTKVKILELRKQMKQLILERINQISLRTVSTDEPAYQRIITSIETFNKQMMALERRSESLLEEEQEEYRTNQTELLQIEQYGPQLSEYRKLLDLQLEIMELQKQKSHGEKLYFFLLNDMYRSNKMITTLCTHIRSYYLLLQGKNMISNEMAKYYENLLKQLDGMKGITWQDQQDYDNPDEDITDPLLTIVKKDHFGLNNVISLPIRELQDPLSLTVKEKSPPNSLNETYEAIPKLPDTENNKFTGKLSALDLNSSILVKAHRKEYVPSACVRADKSAVAAVRAATVTKQPPSISKYRVTTPYKPILKNPQNKENRANSALKHSMPCPPSLPKKRACPRIPISSSPGLKPSSEKKPKSSPNIKPSPFSHRLTTKSIFTR